MGSPRWFLLLLLFILSATPAPSLQQADARKVESLAEGIEHLEIRRANRENDKEMWFINLLILDPKQMRIEVASALDQIIGAETTSSIATRHTALAAINGGYFRIGSAYQGEPRGIFVVGGRLLSEPEKRRAALAVVNQAGQTLIAITHPGFAAKLKIGKQSFTINGYDRPREKDELLIFTPEFHRTTLTAPDGIEAVVVRGRVTNIVERQGSQSIPNEGMVISASGEAAEKLRPYLKRGARVEIESAVTSDPTLPFAPDYLLGGGPQLLRAGKSLADSEAPDYAEPFFRQRHPRTAVGIRADGHLLFITVDGRQPQISVGMTIPELTALMAELGCTDAINLDGGGSTTMVVKNRVVNRPSDQTGERMVSDALLIYPRRNR